MIDNLMPYAEIAFFIVIVLALLIVFARIDKAVYKRMSPVDRLIWRRAFGLRAWR